MLYNMSLLVIHFIYFYWEIIAVYYKEDCSPLGHKESDTTERLN